MEFSDLLFDTLFGLVLYFSIDSFLEIKNPIHFAFYAFSIVILVHWWIMFKACDDVFEKEVTDSVLDLIVGIVELVLIQYIVLTARSFDYVSAGWFLLALLSVDLIWTVIWRYIGHWRTKDIPKIKIMEKELDSNLKIVIISFMAFFVFMLFSPTMTPIIFVSIFILLYLVYITLSFIYKLIDIDIF